MYPWAASPILLSPPQSAKGFSFTGSFLDMGALATELEKASKTLLGPAAVWLSLAHELEDYATRAQRMREVSPMTKIWVQIGSVAVAALRVAELAEPDVLVMQGLDAAKDAGIISELPEAADVLAENGLGHIHLLAAGGIVDGRGVAATLALGAEGVVIGTGFLSAPETMLSHPRFRKVVLTTTDGRWSKRTDRISGLCYMTAEGL